jgi:NTE family protein
MRVESVSITSVALTLLLLVYASVAHGAGEAPVHALILGGGGPVGEAWESGVVAGLAEKGVDLSRTDRIIGTSAGAIVGARLAIGMTPEHLTEEALIRFEGPPPASSQKAAPAPDLSFLVTQLQELNAGKATEQSVGLQVGKWALTLHPPVTESEFVASYWRRFPEKQWPSSAYECVSVDVGNGSPKVWNESSQVPLALAVASSCALPGLFLPVTIDGHRYMDGGARSATNADLASGCKTAIVMAPTSGIDHPLAKLSVARLDRELQILRDNGCNATVIVPDAASVKAFERSRAEKERDSAALKAGQAEGRNWAGEIAGLLSD